MNRIGRRFVRRVCILLIPFLASGGAAGPITAASRSRPETEMQLGIMHLPDFDMPTVDRIERCAVS